MTCGIDGRRFSTTILHKGYWSFETLSPTRSSQNWASILPHQKDLLANSLSDIVPKCPLTILEGDCDHLLASGFGSDPKMAVHSVHPFLLASTVESEYRSRFSWIPCCIRSINIATACLRSKNEERSTNVGHHSVTSYSRDHDFCGGCGSHCWVGWILACPSLQNTEGSTNRELSSSRTSQVHKTTDWLRLDREILVGTEITPLINWKAYVCWHGFISDRVL